MLTFHRKEQFDIIKGGVKKPLLVIGWKTPDSHSRLFCLWSGGVWLRWFGNRRLCWHWAKSQPTPRAADGAYCECLHLPFRPIVENGKCVICHKPPHR